MLNDVNGGPVAHSLILAFLSASFEEIGAQLSRYTVGTFPWQFIGYEAPTSR